MSLYTKDTTLGMLPCAKFGFLSLGVAAALAVFWTIILNMNPSSCMDVYGRICNDQGECRNGICYCNPFYSGEACENTGIMGYIAATGQVCNGNGFAIYNGLTPSECNETTPSRFTSRIGGWNVQRCKNRLRESRKRIYQLEIAENDDALSLPMCLCFPGFGGPGCAESCPRGLNDEICSGNGNKTVDRMRNGTLGDGCQCTSILPIAQALPFLNRDQKQQIAENLPYFERGLCASMQEAIMPKTGRKVNVILPATSENAYKCYCDERHFGDVCEFGVCPQTEEGVFCSGNGHKSFGFGAEVATTRSISAFGERGKPICASGLVLCGYECLTSCYANSIELTCPSERPYRCSTTSQCVGKPKTSRCDQGWEYGYWDDPSRAPRRPMRLGDNRLNSRLVAYFIRVKNGTVSLTYRGQTYQSPENQEFWFGAINETLDESSERAYDSDDETEVQISLIRNVLEFHPAPFVHGSTEYDATIRLRSSYDRYAVLDIIGSRVEFTNTGSTILVNLTNDEFLRPGGSVVTLSMCLDDLSACGWKDDQSGPYSLCERNGFIGSVRGSNACAFPTRPFIRAETIAIARPRVTIAQTQGDTKWYTQSIGSIQETMRVESAGVWVGEYIELDDTRIPCACEPPVSNVVNASVWDLKWSQERTRSTATPGAGYALGKYETNWGDAIWIRGVLQSSGRRLVDKYGDSYEPITESKILTLNEYNRGIPTPFDRAFPHRCPDGRGARPILHVAIDAPASANCTLSRFGAQCDNGCTCTLRKCTCPSTDLESETPLFAELERVRSSEEKCYVVRPQIGNWTRQGNCFQFSTFDVPHEFIAQNVSSIRARFYNGVWTDVSFYSSDRGVYPIVQDIEKPFDEWCVESSDIAIPEFMPAGVAAYRTHPNFTLIGSEDQDNAANVVWNDETTWTTTTNGFLRLNFNEASVRLLGVYVSFRTMGFYIDDEIGSINTTLHLHAGTLTSRDAFKMDWEWIADVSGNVVNGTYSVYVPFSSVINAQSIRLTSRFPMSIRRFVPITDQICSLGTLEPANTYPEDVIIMRDQRVDFNRSIDCVSDDSCMLLGESAAKDGVCSDYKYATWGLEPVEEFSYPVNLTAIQMAVTYVENYTMLEANSSCFSSGCCAWGTDLPDDISECTEDPVANSTYVSALTRFPPNYVPRVRTLIWGSGLIEGVNTCPNGTDYTDCGSSARTEQLSPGLSCDPTPLELAFISRNISVREFQSSALVSELMGMGMSLKFKATWTRNVTTLGRGPCGDCDGRVRCADGTCVDYSSQCPTTLYVTPGDGCVRIDPERKSYKCACAVGFSGLECERGDCVPMDPNTGTGDPHEWCSCAGQNERSFPKLKVKPPFLFKVKSDGYTRKEILAMNRARQRASERDVGWENVRFTEAPWGYAVKRKYVKGGATKWSNCPYTVRVPDGRLVELEECVEERSSLFPFEVVKWKEWEMTNGSKIEIRWDGPWYEVKYDAAPYRCPSGACVSDERECYMSALVNPPCGGKGTCRADGTCACASEWETFVLTNRLSQSVAVPYASKDGVSDPTAWTTPDSVWSHTAMCQARNCTTSDCSPPYGCFVGTVTLNFADRNVTCDVNSGHRGMCAIDQAACRRGEVSLPIPCSGNGILRKRDYKDEWYCECGSPRSLLISDASQLRETTELIPNGFGGPRCEQYLCQDDASKIWFQRTDPRTNKPYVGSDGIPLPGKWRGPCDAPVGPKVEEMGQWRQCCDKKRLDQCTKIPCLKGRVDQKHIVCEEPHLCQDATSRPLVYACNGHGQALADGTCECSNTETEGFTYDESIWSGKGCIRRARCDIAQTSGTMCNKKQNCGDFDSWSEIPKIPYFEQQWPALLLRAGLPPTNQTFVDLVFRDDREQRLEYVASQQGQRVLDAQTNAANSICVYPNDNPLNPIGMVPYDANKVCEYGEGYDDVPYSITNFTALNRPASVRSLLVDGVFGDGVRTENIDYVRLFRDSSSSDSDVETSLILQFPRPTRVKAIRINARKSSNANPSVRVFDWDIGSEFGTVCTAPDPISSSLFDWIGGSQNVRYCVTEYEAFNFRADAYLLEFKSNCLPDEFTTKCTKWKDALCTALGHETNPPGQFIKLLPNCPSGSRCCVATSSPRSEPVTRLAIQIPAGIQERVLDISELQIYGTYDVVEETPSMMSDFIRNKAKGDTECRDGQFMLSIFQGQSLTAHLARNWTNWPVNEQREPLPLDQLNFTQADDACEAMGSRFASNRGGETVDNDAEVLGKACASAAGNVSCWVNARERNTPVNPVQGDVARTPCTRWGCWTPNLPSDQVDFFSTARNDTSGLQWMSEWAGSDYLRLDDAIADLYEEAKFQSELTYVNDKGIGAPAVRTMQPMALSRIRTISSYTNNEAFRAFSSAYLYQLFPWESVKLFTGNTDPVKRSKELIKTEMHATTRPFNKSIWTNPKVCAITVYSRASCGTADISGRSFTLGITYPPIVTRGVQRTFVVTPADDYAALREVNVLRNKVFTECSGVRTGSASGCVGLNSPIIDGITGGIASVSISGPCAVELLALKPIDPSKDVIRYGEGIVPAPANYGRVYAHYIAGPETRPHFVHHVGNPPSYGGFSTWPEGCYGPFRGLSPYTSFFEYMDLQFGTITSPGTNSDNLYASSQTRFPSDGLHDVGIIGMRIIPKFTTRKLDIDYRANRFESSPRNDNAYVLGYNQHPYMCTRVRVVEKVRVYAGVRFPEKYNRVLFDGPARVKKQNITHKIERWSETNIPAITGTPPQFAGMQARRIDRFTIDWQTNVPRESEMEPKHFTVDELRDGMIQLINKGYAINPTDSKKNVFTDSGNRFYSYPIVRTNFDTRAIVATYTQGTVLFYEENTGGLIYIAPNVFGYNPHRYEIANDNPLVDSILKKGDITRGVAFEDSEVVFPFSKCDGVELPREVRRCNTCAPPSTPNWEWNQKFYNPANLRYIQGVNNLAKLPELHVSWNSTKYPALETYQPISKYETTRPDAYARLWSTFTIPDYRRPLNQVNHTTPGHYFDSCAVVRRTSPGSNTFEFRAEVCENAAFRSVCLYDYTRYTIQSGCQCDVCGPDSRSTAYQPNTTVFDLFPLAVRSNFPTEHSIKDAWIEGRLGEFFASNPLPVDSIVSYLVTQTPNAFIDAFPGFYRAFLLGISDRAGFLSRGQIENPDQWIDFDFKRLFPYDCKIVYSRFTGEGRAMCAKSAEFCTRDYTFPTSLMNEADYPRALRGLPEAENPRTTEQCGRLVRPWDLLKSTEDEPPPPNDGLFILQEYTLDDYVTVKTIRDNAGYVRNTFRDIGVIKPGSVLRFQLECLPECEVIFWIGSTNPFFQDSVQRLDLATISSGTHELSVPTDVDLGYRTLGWDFHRASAGTILKIGKVLITDDDSIAACRKSRMMTKWVEPPANVDSPAPQHQCVFTDRIAMILGVRDVGACYCSPASPYGGPSCEWPATISKHSKRICGMFDGIRTSKSKAIAPTGQIVSANEHGVFLYTASDGRPKFGCKMRTDVGSILKTRLIPNSMSDFRYVVKSLARPNEEEFETPLPSEIENLLFNFPVSSDSIRDVCSAFSSSLPSFTTADETEAYLEASYANKSTFLDISLSTMTWFDRGESLLANHSTNYSDPCSSSSLGDAGICRALNFNNYLFNTSRVLTDGSSSSSVVIVSSSSETFTVRTDLEPRTDFTVEMYSNTEVDFTGLVEVSVSSGGAFTACSAVEVEGVSECALASSVTHIRVTALLDASVYEIRAFWKDDGARTYAW
jgi:hypothetical protein